VTEQTLGRARAGEEDAFRELTDLYRRELQLHIYRIVGSAQDAEDVLQETLLAAWGDSSSSRDARRSGLGSTGSPPTARWTRSVRVGAAPKTFRV
jgi:DNA-directed RNA polymerase specialized sigma24 family protein